MKVLRKLLGLEETRVDEARDTATVRRIAAELDALPPDQARFLAAFAYVLARVARADLDVSAAESAEISRMLRQFSTLSEAQALLVAQIAKSQAALLGGTENYLVTRQFKEISSREQRVDLLRCLFALAATDGGISQIESTEVTAIGLELGFAREEIAGMRGGFRDQLLVLKDLPG